MNATITRVEDIPKLGRTEAMRLAAAEYERFGDLLRSLGPDDWSRPTDCDRWDVGNVVSHLVGMSQAFASFPRELVRQQRASKPLAAQLGLTRFDAWTEHQSRMHPAGPSLVAAYVEGWPGTLRRRQRFPLAFRAMRLHQPPYGWWPLSYLIDDILTRDVWMHRVDISRATGREVVLTPEHDARFVANLVRDLANRWRRPFTLALDGPAGGRFVYGTGGDERRLDAVEFCRILSGRAEGHDLPTRIVPF